jgi:hypothetical protein
MCYMWHLSQEIAKRAFETRVRGHKSLFSFLPWAVRTDMAVQSGRAMTLTYFLLNFLPSLDITKNTIHRLWCVGSIFMCSRPSNA